MGKVIVLEETTKNPITLIGKRAGVCWGGDIEDDTKNYLRGMDCIKSGHGRTFEFVNVEMVLDGWSARVIREWYTHIGGGPTRLQASTRYIDYKDGSWIIPDSLKKDPELLDLYNNEMHNIHATYKRLLEAKVPKEDIANLLPLGMLTRVVDKRNLRNLIDMSHQRLCSRAYWEFRDLFNEIMRTLSEYSDEWNTVMGLTFMPKCVMLGYCPERYSCGRMPKK